MSIVNSCIVLHPNILDVGVMYKANIM